MRILIAEDDTHILNGLREILEQEGYETIAAKDGKKALDLYAKSKPDLVCLDIMMPEISGYDVCREIRKEDRSTPILFISAKSEEIDKVLGLELGADDFIMKPFGVREVVARIRAVTRRYLLAKTPSPRTEPFHLGDLEIVPAEMTARRSGTDIELGLRDLNILRLFYEKKGEVIDRDTFYDRCWGTEYFPNSRALDQHIAQLRKRIEVDPKDPKIIRTVHGVGYQYEST